MERSVDERAMDRVDAVTRKTMLVNTRQRAEIENLHKEVSSTGGEQAREGSGQGLSIYSACLTSRQPALPGWWQPDTGYCYVSIRQQ